MPGFLELEPYELHGLCRKQIIHWLNDRSGAQFCFRLLEIVIISRQYLCLSRFVSMLVCLSVYKYKFVSLLKLVLLVGKQGSYLMKSILMFLESS
jgi:hypothetical protein